MSNDREAVLLALEEAAQEVTRKLKILREVLKEDALVRLSETHQQLTEALAEKSEEYECIGCINGTHAGRWLLWAENAAAVWPDNTAVYVRRGVKR
jgi:enolase